MRHDSIQFAAVLLTAVVVGFEMLSYTVGEGDGQVELCVNITMPRRQDIGTVTFNLTVETQDDSAGSANNRSQNTNYKVGVAEIHTFEFAIIICM